jgi:ribosomal protein S18 acetylase RimI-like enzyme
VTIDALTVGGGIGGPLIEAVVEAARAAGCARVHLITTNDNLPALRLYQRHGFVLTELRAGQIDKSRELKPGISATGHAGIPIRDELVLVRSL